MTQSPLDADPLFEAIDLPSLLATTAARQAMTPTAQLQARLASPGAIRHGKSEEKIASSFSTATRNLLRQKNAR